MSDWADERVQRSIMPKGYTLAEIQSKAAQLIRDVQRETAETCAKLAGMAIVVPKNGDCVPAVTKQLQDSVNAIKKHFNLEGE